MRGAQQYNLLDAEIVVELSRNAECNRLDIERISLRCVVECNLVRVVVVAGVRRLEVCLVALIVVALAHLATMDVVGAVGVARNGNNTITAYPGEIHGQHYCYFRKTLH